MTHPHVAPQCDCNYAQFGCSICLKHAVNELIVWHTGTNPDYQVVSTTLKQLKHIQVTQQLLLGTGAGKAMKAMTKSNSPEVSEAAQQVVKAWKRCLLQA